MSYRAPFVSAVLSAALFAAPAGAAARAHARAPDGFARWADGAASLAWRGGGEATLAWEPGPRFQEEAAGTPIREWEAFLSLDGGRTWPIRLTPHLSTSVRRVTVELPPLVAPDARLLLRFGDERRELELELPQRIRIEAPRRERVWPARRAWHAGEAARPGARGAVFWADGDRAAAAIELYESSEAEPHVAPAIRPGRPALLAPARTQETRIEPPPIGRAISRSPLLVASGTFGRDEPAQRSLAPLRASCRLNL